jgi:hypothetical protein
MSLDPARSHLEPNAKTAPQTQPLPFTAAKARTHGVTRPDTAPRATAHTTQRTPRERASIRRTYTHTHTHTHTNIGSSDHCTIRIHRVLQRVHNLCLCLCLCLYPYPYPYPYRMSMSIWYKNNLVCAQEKTRAHPPSFSPLSLLP